MAQLPLLIQFVAGDPAVADDVNQNFTDIRNHINGANIDTENISATLTSRTGGPILFLDQATQNQLALSIQNSQTNTAMQILQSAALADASKAVLKIDSPTTQTTGKAELWLDLAGGSTIPAILVEHGADTTASLTKTQLNLFNSTIQATSTTLNLFSNAIQASSTSLNLFSSAIEFSNARIKIPVRTTTERNVITQEGSVLYDSSKKELSVRTDTTWIPASTPTGCIQMYAGSSAPQGWLYCNGAVVSQLTYPDLFAVISTTYNTGGEGAGNFRLPNFVGIFPRGAEMGGISSQAISGITYIGNVNNTKQADQMQGHKHLTYDPDAGSVGITTFTPQISIAASLNYGYNTGNYNTGVPKTDGTNGTPRTGTQTYPANIAIAYIIKT